MIILYTVFGYLAVGVLVTVPFLINGIGLVDEAAKESPWTVKLTLLPGCVVFWPVVLQKYIHAVKQERHD
jgi:hypothetical protein